MQRAEIKQLICDIVVCITTAQDNVEMDWLVYGNINCFMSTVYCKFDSLNMCILQYCVLMTMCMCFLSL